MPTKRWALIDWTSSRISNARSRAKKLFVSSNFRFFFFNIYIYIYIYNLLSWPGRDNEIAFQSYVIVDRNCAAISPTLKISSPSREDLWSFDRRTKDGWSSRPRQTLSPSYSPERSPIIPFLVRAIPFSFVRVQLRVWELEHPSRI